MKRGFIGLLVVIIFLGGYVLARQAGEQREISGSTDSGTVSEKTIRELAAVMSKLDSEEVLLLTGSYQLYDATSNLQLETEEFMVAKKGGDLYWKVGYIEQVFRNGNFALINNNDHRIMTQRSNENTQHVFFRGLSELQDFLNAPGAVVKESIRGKNKFIAIEMGEDGFIEKGTIEYDSLRLELRSSSMNMSTWTPDSDEPRKVTLRLEIDNYRSTGVETVVSGYIDKVRWAGKRVILTDSLRNYRID